jgi:hypothetical protein
MHPKFSKLTPPEGPRAQHPMTIGTLVNGFAMQGYWSGTEAFSGMKYVVSDLVCPIEKYVAANDTFPGRVAKKPELRHLVWTCRRRRLKLEV